MAYDVRLLQGTQANYDALATKDSSTLYFITTPKAALYLGSLKITSIADLESALTRIGAAEDNITAILAAFEGITITGTGATTILDTIESITGDLTDLDTTAKTDLVAAINELKAEIGSTGEAGQVTIYEPTQSDYAHVYEFYQGDDGTHAPAKKIGTVNIPKDIMVESGSVVTVVFDSSTNTLHEGSISGTDVTAEIKGADTPTSADAGDYIKLVLANSSDTHIWIKATALVDIYTSGSTPATDEIVITVDSANKTISASVGTSGIAASKIKIADAGGVITATDVEGALQELANAIANIDVSGDIADAIGALDAVADSTKTEIDGDTARTPQNGGVFALQSLTEADGKLTAMGVVEVDAAGSAAAAETAAKAYTDAAMTWGTIPSAT